MAKYSISSYTADGTTTDFLLTWDYLDKTHITVYVDDVNVADAGSGFTSTLINSTTVRVTTDLAAPVPAGKIVELRRETPIDTQAVTFNDGSSLNGGDLNTNTDYLLYAMQEAIDTVDIAAQNGAQAAQVATEGFRDEAEVFKDDAQASATSAAFSAGAAQVSATNAAGSESSAAADAASALASKNAAEQSEINAAGHELVAGTHATNAGADRALAQAAKTAAEAAQTAAEAAWDSFDDRYLGSKASAPTLDNDGNALVAGALYWNTTSSLLQIYTGSAWENVATSSTTPSFTSVTAGQVNSSGAVIAAGAGSFGDDVDVTGTVTADGLVTDTTNGVKINTGSVAEASWTHLDVTGTSTINVGRNSTWGGNLIIQTDTKNRANFASNGDISFYEDTGTTPKFFWDASAEALGIGTTSPGKALHVNSGTGNIGIRVESSDATASIEFMDSGTTSTLTSARVGGISDDFFVQTNGSERLRIDSSGNVGIGTSSPANLLQLNSASTSAKLHVTNSTTGSTASDGFELSVSGLNTYLVNREAGFMAFQTSNTERMRIDSSGNLLVGTTSATLLQNNDSISFLPDGTSAFRTDSGVLTKLISFQNQGGEKGNISVTTTATAYNTSSDYRLKEDVQPMTGASQRVLALNPVNFAWKADGTRVDGFLAHEAQAVVPEAVTGTKDAMDADGNPDYQAIDQSKLVPLLTAALQEALGEIESLKARLDAAGL